MMFERFVNLLKLLSFTFKKKLELYESHLYTLDLH